MGTPREDRLTSLYPPSGIRRGAIASTHTVATGDVATFASTEQPLNWADLQGEVAERLKALAC